MRKTVEGFRPLRPGKIHLRCPGCGRKQSNMPREDADPTSAVVAEIFCDKHSGGKDSETSYYDANGAQVSSPSGCPGRGPAAMTDARTPGQEKISERAEKAWAGFEAQRLELGFGEHGHLWAIDRDSFMLGYQFAEADLLAHITTRERAVAEAKEGGRSVSEQNWETEAQRYAQNADYWRERLTEAEQAHTDQLAALKVTWEAKDADLSSARRALAERDAELLGARQAFDDCDRIACREKDRADSLTSTLAEAHAEITMLRGACREKEQAGDGLIVQLAEAHAALDKIRYLIEGYDDNLAIAIRALTRPRPASRRDG